ncbi:MAG: helix-turn-helix domain-containing protein [Thermoprotei archaeon]
MSEGSADIFEVLGNETRRRILELLAEEPAYLNELSRELRVSQQAVLKHLEYLLDRGLIEPCTVDYDSGGTPPKKYYRLSKSLTFLGGLTPSVMEYAIAEPDIPRTNGPLKLEVDPEQLQARLEDIMRGDEGTSLRELREFIRGLDEKMRSAVTAYSILMDTKRRALEYGRDTLRGKLKAREERKILYRFLAMDDEQMKEYFEGLSRTQKEWLNRISETIDSIFG